MTLKKERGNGAREVLQRYLAANYEPKHLSREDHLLAWLWKEGYWVAPITIAALEDPSEEMLFDLETLLLEPNHIASDVGTRAHDICQRLSDYLRSLTAEE
jgi:hypothetical protein